MYIYIHIYIYIERERHKNVAACALEKEGSSSRRKSGEGFEHRSLICWRLPSQTPAKSNDVGAFDIPEYVYVHIYIYIYIYIYVYAHRYCRSTYIYIYIYIYTHVYCRSVPVASVVKIDGRMHAPSHMMHLQVATGAHYVGDRCFIMVTTVGRRITTSPQVYVAVASPVFYQKCTSKGI